MTTDGSATPAAEARAHREDEHLQCADDRGSHPAPTVPEVPTAAHVAANRSGLPVRLVYRRRPTA